MENLLTTVLPAAYQTPEIKNGLKITFCTLGIVGSLVLYGILQERIMTQPYGEEEEHFTYSVFLVLNNRCVSMVVAALVLAVKKSSVAPVAGIHKYAAVSVSNVIATTCQYEALKYVSFPVQTLGKCAKMVPVMIWGTFIGGKKYGLGDYLIALVVTLGCTAFLLFGEVSSSAAKKHNGAGGRDTSIYGMMLMGGYLGFDGFTSTFQDMLFKGYQMETYNQMLWVTMCSAAISAFWLLGDSSLGAAIAFVSRHPAAMSDIFTLSCSSTMGQLFILYTIREYGALVFATIMTTRQFISILLSCLLFFHPLSAGQWLGTVMVFGAIYYKSFAHGKKKTPKEQPAPEEAKGIKDLVGEKDVEEGAK